MTISQRIAALEVEIAAKQGELDRLRGMKATKDALPRVQEYQLHGGYPVAVIFDTEAERAYLAKLPGKGCLTLAQYEVLSEAERTQLDRSGTVLLKLHGLMVPPNGARVLSADSVRQIEEYYQRLV